MLADVIVAIAIVAAFVAVVGQLTIAARSTFNRSRDKKLLVDAYLDHEADIPSLMPYQSFMRDYQYASTSVKVLARASWYGNDMIETDIDVSDGDNGVTFTSVRIFPFANVAESAGTAFCSVRHMSGQMLIRSLTLPTNPTLPLTDLVVRNGVAYISADSNISSDPDLFVIDISSTSVPVINSSLNTGPGISSIAVAGNHVFAAAASTAAQLHIVRLDGLQNISLIKKYELPLPEASTTPTTGSSIYYDRGKVYLGTEKWGGDELSVIDVSVPDSPNKISGWEVNSKVTAILSRFGAIYLASSDSKQLVLLDGRNYSNISELSYFSPSGYERQDGKAVTVFEDGVYFGRSSGGFDIATDHELFTWNSASTTTSVFEPMRLSQLSSVSYSHNEPGGVYGVVATRGQIYAISRTVDRELIVGGIGAPTTTLTYYSLPVRPQSITCDGDKIYILAKNAPFIYEISFR